MTATDRIEKIGHSKIHHGPLNDRLYLMKLDPRDMPEIVPRIMRLARRNDYGKILAKVPHRVAADFRRNGFVCEARIPAFYRSGEDALFLALFPDAARRKLLHRSDIERSRKRLQTVVPKSASEPNASQPPVRVCRPGDIPEMRRLYRRVFPSYPFPIYDRQYLAATMNADVRYYGVRDEQGRMVALASCEMDLKNRAVEMTDFAVLPARRGRGISGFLLRAMEADMDRCGMRTAFTIARTRSPGINVVFRRGGYRRAGMLVNNTHIAGDIESMWVWHKRMPGADSD